MGRMEHFSGKQKHNVQKPRNNGRGSPYDGFVGRLRPTGLPFSGFSYTVYERIGISLGRTNELNGVHVPFLLRMVYKKKGQRVVRYAEPSHRKCF